MSNALTVVIGWLARARTAQTPEALREAVEVAYQRACDGRHIARRAIGAESLPAAVLPSLEGLVASALVGILPEAAPSSIVLASTLDEAAKDLPVPDATVALQILTNLLLNAVAFSPAGSTVRVEGRLDEGCFLIRVADEGPGIPEPRLPTVFTRGRTTRSGGAGVGLHYARSLARERGGDVTVEPSEVGASFALTWPIGILDSLSSDAPTQRTPSQPAPPEPRAEVLAGKRVLVVEDDPAVLILLEMALAHRGAAVICARSRDELRGALADERRPFDAALLDLSPLGADPLGGLDTLRAHSPAARLVVISGSPDLPAGSRDRTHGWIRKPFDVGDVVRALSDEDA